MLYLIGLGLDKKGISLKGLEAVKKCKVVYLENYTVNFPYSVSQLSEVLGKKIILANREFIEGLEIVDSAKKKDVALLIYGSPLMATTHITLVNEAKHSRVKCKIIQAGSVLDAVAETGLQIYKFGKIASMPKWDLEKNFTPASFMGVVKVNESIEAHSLILIDISLKFNKAIEQLTIAAKEKKIKIGRLIVCSNLGTKHSKIYYGKIEELKTKKIFYPFCFILPSKLHFVEKESLERFR
ncbi:MAG: diphthine synthase [Candidatus Pacearchaeota archaeon]|jgi:diphthine synthase